MGQGVYGEMAPMRLTQGNVTDEPDRWRLVMVIQNFLIVAARSCEVGWARHEVMLLGIFYQVLGSYEECLRSVE